MTTTTAAVTEATGAPFVLPELEAGELRAGEVLVDCSRGWPSCCHAFYEHIRRFSPSRRIERAARDAEEGRTVKAVLRIAEGERRES